MFPHCSGRHTWFDCHEVLGQRPVAIRDQWSGTRQGNIQRRANAVIEGMTTLLIAAFAAGMVSTFNPCGFAMLPAYLGIFLGEGSHRRLTRIGTVAFSVAGGFLVVFTVAGVLIGIGIRAVVGALPWMALVVGLGLVVFGVAQLLGKRLLPYLRGPGRVRKSGSPAGMFVFGVSYAVASLSCTLPIFLSLVTGAIASGSLGQAVLTFVAYGGGMAVVVVGLTLAVAGGRRAIVDRMRPLASRLDQISGWIMLVAGGFIVWYWATILSSGAVALGSNRLVRLVDEWSSAVTRFIASRPLVIGLLVIVALLWTTFRSKVGTTENGSDSRDRTADDSVLSTDDSRG
ncbi:hypothetical protein BH23ACT5_BH23ACT5_22310 [soil metagenome]